MELATLASSSICASYLNIGLLAAIFWVSLPKAMGRKTAINRNTITETWSINILTLENNKVDIKDIFTVLTNSQPL